MIRIQQLYKYYGEERALGPVDAEIDSGEVIGLLGLNGAGKTTTLRILACDLLPTSGTVTVGGCDVVEEPDEVRKKVGYLPDTPPLYGEMSVDEFLRYAAKLRGVGAAELERRVSRVIEQTELGEVRSQLIATLSHGFKQRVGIAQAVVHGPPLVVLDEPISGLDPAQIVEMRALVRSLRGDHTVIVSSHILGEISETCDRLLVIRDGHIVASGTEAELVGQQQGVRVELSIRAGADAEPRLRAALARVDSAADVVIAPATESGHELLSARVTTDEDHRAAYCRAIVEEGLELIALGRSRRELESVFLELSMTGAEAAEHFESGRDAGALDREEPDAVDGSSGASPRVPDEENA